MSNQRSAFTLLEVLLTLSLAVALMLLIGGAMQFYGRTMNASDMDIQLTQLGTALIRISSTDLVSALGSTRSVRS